MISFRKFLNFFKCTSVVILAFSGLRLSAVPQSAPAPIVDTELLTQIRLAPLARGDNIPAFTPRLAAPLAAPTPVITSTNEDTPIDIDVLGNNVGSFTITNVITNTTLGSVSINNPAQTIHYDPTLGLNFLAANQAYLDTFQYIASEITGTLTYTVPVTVTVSGVNDSPIAANDAVTTTEDTPKDFIVLANDYDPDTSDVITVTKLTTSGLQGTATINLDNTIHYDPGTIFDYLQQGQTASTGFSYTISDGHGGTASANVSVTITGVNDPPIAANDTVTTTEDTPKDFIVLANDRDPDAGTTLTVTGLNTSGLQGTASINPDNTIHYDPGTVFDYLQQGQTASTGFSYTISDGHGGTANANVSVTITGVNDPPIAANDTVTTTEDTPTDIIVLANDSDPDAGTTLTVTGLNTTGLLGTASINPDKTIHYNPGTLFNYLQQGQTASTGFSYTISDGHGGTASAKVSLTITGVNDPPVAVKDSATTGENTAIDINVLGNDNDPDAGTTLTVTGLITTGLKGNATINSNNTIHYNPRTAFDYLAVGETGTTSFQYTISDGHGGTASATVNITVNGVNDSPTAASDSASTSEDSATNINVLANDHDPDTSDTLTVTGLNTTGLKGTANINPNNTIHYNPGTVFNYLQQGQTASTGFSYTISDGHGGTSSAKVSLTITGVNDPPVAVNDHYYTRPITFTVSAPGVLANDYDVDTGDHLKASLILQPANGHLKLNGDGSFTYTPDSNFSFGNDRFNYRVYDSLGAPSNTAWVTITVDASPPNLNWQSPMGNGGIYDALSGQQIPLVITATDNIPIAWVEFFWWDPKKGGTGGFVDIASLSHAPFRALIDVDSLNIGWNQVFARAYDAAGNVNNVGDPAHPGFIWIIRKENIYLPLLSVGHSP
jgi:VCBS repeat-containing protein